MSCSERIEQYPPISGAEEHSFARFTILERLPVILDQIIEYNDLDSGITAELEKLKSRLREGSIQNYITTGSDRNDWNSWLQPLIGTSWLDLPFYFAEAYFYRLVLDIIGFSNFMVDPYLVQKQNDIHENRALYIDILVRLQHFNKQDPNKDEMIRYLLSNSLWGNRSDLSQLQLDRNQNTDLYQAYTLIDHSDHLFVLLQERVNRIDIVLDNSGIELFTDLVLAEQFLLHDICGMVVLHAKTLPTFVSDATFQDIEYLISYLQNIDNQYLRELINQFQKLRTDHRIVVKDHHFWNSPLPFYQMPRDLHEEISTSDLLIFKGDANYRRIFGDRKIPPEKTSKEFADYLPAKSLAIRTLKSEIIVGMNMDLVNEMHARDKEWLINGKYGIIQMIK